MHISSATYENFRNFQSLDIKFNQGFVVLAGPNGAGKTNFLEGLYFGSAVRRFPDSKFNQLFRLGEKFLRLRIGGQGPEPVFQEIYAEDRGGKYIYKFLVNNQETNRNKYAGALPTISFIPQDLNLLTRAPGNRRRYLNETLAASSPKYRHGHAQYAKVLQQRNELWDKIKTGQADSAELGVWDEQLAEFGSQICAARAGFIAYLNRNLPSILAVLSPELQAVKFVYQMAGRTDKTDFLAELQKRRALEQERWTTVFGPHRDDFQTHYFDHDAVGFVSRGQMRSITLALKLIEKQYVEQELRHSPVVLLDDVFSEFDSAHQQKLIEHLKSQEQVFITTSHLEEVKNHLPGSAQIYQVLNGEINSDVS